MGNVHQHKSPLTDDIGVISPIITILANAKDALFELTPLARGLHIFWLLGPFFMLIERTPGDVWISFLALSFVIRVTIKKERQWLKSTWVRAAFLFWFWCLFSAAMSPNPLYSFGEAFVWFRFPLFAMATVFWLALDRRLLYAMLLSVGVGTLIMGCILASEILIIGQQDGRLLWPYGDKTPGNYLAKVGLPVFTIMVAIAVSSRVRVAGCAGIFALFSIILSLMTGERINFLVRACSGFLAGVVWKPIWRRFFALIFLELIALIVAFTLLPGALTRFSKDFFVGATNFETSGWLHTINGGFVIARDNLLTGIGPGNFRIFSHELLEGVPYTRPDNHPHNLYSQLLCETGAIGFLLGVVFLWSMVWACFKESLKSNKNVFIATAWITPFALFWPIATNQDFFGQWNNIFMWSALAISMTSVRWHDKTDISRPHYRPR